jgi:alpha-galactosidase
MHLQSVLSRAALFLACLNMGSVVHAQDAAKIHFDSSTKIFRLDAGGVTYAFGVNNADELQPVYWGKAVAMTDAFPAARTLPEAAAFDFSAMVTPQEYAGWGGGLTTEPALKVSYPDGNRDLVLHYVSHTIAGDDLTIRTKDIERDLFVELHYTIDAVTGIVGRSAVIENKSREMCGLARWRGVGHGASRWSRISCSRFA